MLENLAGTINIYGNVFLGLRGASGANGLNANSGRSGVVYNVFNNTFVAKGTASNNVLNMRDNGTANVRNNVFHLQNQMGIANPGAITMNRSYNLWFGSNIPSCSGTGEVCRVDPLFSDYANNNFSLQSSSPAKGTATNLGAAYEAGVAPGATWPEPTLVLRTGSWDRGAFHGGGTSTPPAPSAPSNLRIVTP
jgi:hypothetical protein